MMTLCEWEAITERTSPVTGKTMELCAQCAEAYDLGFNHGQVPADQVVPPKEEDEEDGGGG